MLWKLLLQEHGGFDPIVEVADGAAAASVLESSGCFDVILTNFSMPDISGFEVIEASRQRCPNAIIIMASASDVARSEALQRGASDFLTKHESTERLMPLLFHRLADRHHDR